MKRVTTPNAYEPDHPDASLTGAEGASPYAGSPAESAPPASQGWDAAQSGYGQAGDAQYGYQQASYGAPNGYQQHPQYGAQPGYDYGAPAQNPYGAASWDTGASAAPTAAGWAPAPKSGLIPLRPLTFGEIFSGTFRLLRVTPGVTIGSAVLITGLTTLITAGLPILMVMWNYSRLVSADAGDDTVFMGSFGIWLMLSMIPGLLASAYGSGLLQSIIAQVVAAATVTRTVSFGEAWKRALRNAWPILGYFLMVGAAALLAFGIIFGLTAWLAWLAQDNQGLIALIVVIGILIFIGLLVVSAWLSVRLLFVPSAIVLEGLGPIKAIRRSWQLSQGYFWRTLGISLLLQAIVGTVGQVVSGGIGFVMGIIIPIMAPTGGIAEGQEGAIITVLIILMLLSMVVSVIISTLTVVLIAGNAVVMYTDLRMRKEGLNIHLQQAVDELAEGREPTEDPWTAADLGPTVTQQPPAWQPPPQEAWAGQQQDPWAQQQAWGQAPQQPQSPQQPPATPPSTWNQPPQ